MLGFLRQPNLPNYDALRNRMAILEGIARGEKAVQDGRTLTHA